MRKVIIVAAVCATTFANAQFGDMLKKELNKQAKKTAEQAVDPEKMRNKLDSSDFNYAITVIDNSGMMNVKDLNERVVKTLNMGSSLTKSESEKTAVQKCREKLDFAEKAYEEKQFTLAEFFFLDAKAAYESAGLTGNINYSKIYADLGLLYATMGRFSTSEKFTEEALTIREKTLGKDSKAYASSLNNIAVLHQETAHYNEAEAYFDQALQTVEKQLGKESQEYATVLNNQAILFSEIGRIESAVSKLNNAIDILERLKKKNLRDQVGFQSNLALLYQQTGKFAEAEAVYLKLEKSLGSSNPYYAGVLNSLATLYIQMGKLDKVEDYLKKSASVYKSQFGDQNPNYAKVLNDLGNFYRMQGRFDEAEQSLSQALSIRSTALDVNHPDYVKSLEDLGILYWKKGDIAKASTNYQDAMTKSLDFINRYFPPMSEAEKTKYWDVLQPRFQRYYNFCLDASTANPAVLQDMYDYQMATKGLLLSSTNKIKSAILSSGNAELIKDYVAWLDKKETLARYYSLSKEDLTKQKIDLPALEKEANDMERSLSSRSGDFSKGYSTEKVSLAQVAAVLADNEAIVEFVRIRSFDKDFTADSKYAALVLVKGATAPKLVVLDNGNQLETRYAKYFRNCIQQRIADQFSYEQFWARIDPALAGKKTIYVSADGVYNQISLNTLKKPDGDFVLNRYDLVMVGNSKDVMSLKSRKPSLSRKSAFLLGFPDYGGDAVAALPGTKVEVETIAGILNTGGYKVTPLLQKDATEAVVKAIKGMSLVHIATHGYFHQDVEQNTIGVNEVNAKNNPLLRSGILLAGASPTIKGEVMPNLESNDNGVLTAYEAMNLSLEGTDLIILSACETGLGEIRAGEGVYGLQRSFLVAGAKALVMSLWKVDDAATQALMTNFYTNLSKGGSKRAAFKQAQVQLMTKYKDPYYWGAFVMMGQ
jgi:CHAT domain-containing protein/tetratricopeptide (TPR) repeat protein